MQNMARVVGGGFFGQKRKKGWGLVCHGGSNQRGQSEHTSATMAKGELSTHKKKGTGRQFQKRAYTEKKENWKEQR